jgi:hypothetical protein
VAAHPASCAPCQHDYQGRLTAFGPLSRRPFFRHIRVAGADDLSRQRITKFRPFAINGQAFPIGQAIS